MKITSRLFSLSIALFTVTKATAGAEMPTSALEYQQTSNTRIVVEENFLRFFTGAEERITVDGNGNVGIGSTAPGNSRLKLSGNSSYYMFYLVNDHVDANNFTPLARFQTANATNRGLWVDVYNAGATGEYLRLGSLGNIPLSLLPTGGHVGVGTTNPQYAKVQIRGGATHELLAVNRPDSDVPALYLGNDGTTNAAIASNNSDLTFGRDFGGTYEEYMRLKNGTGRLGIGLNQPQSTLDVMGKAVFRGTNVGSATINENSVSVMIGPNGTRPGAVNNYNPGIGFNHLLTYQNNPATPWKDQLHAWIGTRITSLAASEQSALVFATTSGTGAQHTQFPTEKMVIMPDGKVGIGTPSPGYNLDVAGTVQSDYLKLNATNSTNEGGEIMLDGAASYNEWKIDNYTGHFRLHHSGSEKLRLNSNGNLQVNGNIHGSTFTATTTPNWPDYVFEDSYELNDIKEVEKYIEKNHHLPEIPSAAEVKENGVDIVAMQAKLLQKIEELTLYVIELKKENQVQQKEIQELKKK